MKQTKLEMLEARPAPKFTERQLREPGLTTQIAAMLKTESPSKVLNRRQWRSEARFYIKNPIHYEKLRREAEAEKKQNQERRGMLTSLLSSLFRFSEKQKAQGAKT